MILFVINYSVAPKSTEWVNPLKTNHDEGFVCDTAELS